MSACIAEDAALRHRPSSLPLSHSLSLSSPSPLLPPSLAAQTGSVIAVICMVIVQFMALVWYTLSYIPYARDLVWTAMTKCFTGGG